MPKPNPKITVTMPAYNASKYINEAIKSVLDQDYESFELLILDDGSTDNTWDVIQKYKKDPRVRIYRNKKNTGGGAARNKTIRLAKGKYISFCDADDLMLPGNLKTLSQYLDNHPKIGMVYPKALIVRVNNKNKLISPAWIKGKDFYQGWDLMENALLQGGAMIRKPLFFKAGGYDETSYYSDVDYGLWLKLTEITTVKYLDKEIFYVVVSCPKKMSREERKRYTSYILLKKAQTIKRRYNYEFKV